jgi:hypothetical protein
MSGRPNEGRVKLTCYVLPLTAKRIAFLVDKTKPDANTQGKVVDSQFGVRASKKVAGAGRRVCAGQHGRAKRSSSRAKRANIRRHQRLADRNLTKGDKMNELDDIFADTQEACSLHGVGSCRECAGTGGIDSGGVTPWMDPIFLQCPVCKGSGDEPSSAEKKAATEKDQRPRAGSGALKTPPASKLP